MRRNVRSMGGIGSCECERGWIEVRLAVVGMRLFVVVSVWLLRRVPPAPALASADTSLWQFEAVIAL